jgi:hypothetical protein
MIVGHLVYTSSPVSGNMNVQKALKFSVWEDGMNYLPSSFPPSLLLFSFLLSFLCEFMIQKLFKLTWSCVIFSWMFCAYSGISILSLGLEVVVYHYIITLYCVRSVSLVTSRMVGAKGNSEMIYRISSANIMKRRKLDL